MPIPTNTMHQSLRGTILSILCWIVAAMLQSGCSTSPTALAEGTAAPARTNGTPPPKSVRSRVRVAVIQDKTLSAGETRTPQLTLEDVDPLVELLGQTGGEVAVSVIHDRSNLNFARLRIDAGPEEPVAPIQADNPLERRNQRTAYRKQKEEFARQQQAWQDDMQSRIGEFQKLMDPMLAMAPDAKHSPVWDAVKRADLFLYESDSDGNADPHHYAVLITDGIDDVGARPVPVHSGARVLIVNGAAQLGSLAVLKPQRFESIGAAIHYIVSLETK